MNVVYAPFKFALILFQGLMLDTDMSICTINILQKTVANIIHR